MAFWRRRAQRAPRARRREGIHGPGTRGKRQAGALHRGAARARDRDRHMTPREHRIHVRRSARFYTLGDPGPELKECWLVCHGYGQLAGRFAQSFAHITSPQRCLIFPEGLSRFYLDDEMRHKVGASWMTKEDREAEMADYVAYLDAVYEQVMRGDAGVQVT